MNPELRERLISNGSWFLASIVLGVLIWTVATLQANPVGQQRFLRIPVQVRVDDGMIVTNEVPDTVRVLVEAQESVLGLLTEEDITVIADLSGLGDGTHVIPLQVTTSRPARADTQPAQVTVNLETLITRQRPVDIVEAVAPPSSYRYDVVERDVVQAQVSGASDAVNRVIRVVGRLNLQDQRNDFERTMTLIAVDENDQDVNGVSITPRTMTISVDMTPRDDLREVTIRPDILYSTLPENFVLRDINAAPQVALISGSPDALATLGDTIDTAPISLANQMGDFVVEVPLILDDGLTPLAGNIVRVEVFINEQTTSITLQGVPITIIGALDGMIVRVNPETISVLLNGTVSQLDGVTGSDIQAILDVSGLAVGTYDLTPTISIRQGQVEIGRQSITLIPATVTVTIASDEVATATPLP